MAQDTTIRRPDTARSAQDTLRIVTDSTKKMIPADSISKVAGH